MAVKDLHDALVHEMRDVLSAEKQITKALKKMSRKANSEELRGAFDEHLEQTEEHIQRLEKAFGALDLSPRAHRCEAMSGLIEEGEEAMEEAEDEVVDALLILAAQKVEHYEMAAYGTLCAWAQQLGHAEPERLFRQTLEEEKQTDERLTKLASELNRQVQPQA